ncbi:phosphatase PAP2 family protein [Rhizobium multihospitium]|uniref:Undecaprenyl-diphosphatase n=1 Tax=Rhizobium multihospitium TaxID=410764 RepID=A0A1C3VWY5_9HYPH|nr:phosphatase PAP2 family protein [Rhizobium multihospitium]SCB32084.1 undecaprenyl-diphosphatase [Rhizobium multihospitium]
MYKLDAAITGWINSLAGNGLLDQVLITISNIGVPLLILAVAGQWWSGSERAHTRHVLVAAGLTFLIGLGINQIILLFDHRIRPYDAGITRLLIERSTDPSFPSDHATASFAIAAAFLIHNLPKRGLFFLVAAVLVSFSRVYIGTHYISDVMGGALTAIFAAILVQTLYKPETRIDRFITSIL